MLLLNCDAVAGDRDWRWDSATVVVKDKELCYMSMDLVLIIILILPAT